MAAASASARRSPVPEILWVIFGAFDQDAAEILRLRLKGWIYASEALADGLESCIMPWVMPSSYFM
jgi:hypothetical protein